VPTIPEQGQVQLRLRNMHTNPSLMILH